MKFFLIFLIYVISIGNLSAFENKIILKIEDEIITSIDIDNEKNYLKALNPNIRNLDNNKLNLISKNSIIREKIKENELLKFTENIKLDKKILSKLIKERYSRLGISSMNQFMSYIQKYKTDIKTIEKKISIEALWNQLIYQKFSKNIKIDKDKLINEIKNKFALDEKNFLLSEIVFKVDNKKDLDKKYTEIIKDIDNENFESAALIHSISDSSTLGGKLGWIKETSLNKSIIDILADVKKGDITKPVYIGNRYLILKIEDIKYVKKTYDEKNELNELIKIKTNKQLNQQSIIYFNKIKKNITINEL